MSDKEIETEIMRDAFCLLRDFSAAPPIGAAEAGDYWQEVGKRMTEICEKHGHHTLAEKMVITLFEYLERKAYMRQHERDNKAD